MNAERLASILLILAALWICYFTHLGALGFAGPDEPRYAWIAREMAESGDWVTPRLYGHPWFEKPVLYYWEAAASFKLFGVSEMAARLPSAVSALLATLALGWLVLRLYGERTARWFMILLPTSVGMIGFSHAAATDMPFSGMLTIAMVGAAVVIGLTRDESVATIRKTPLAAATVFGIFLGLAILAKGPAAIILVGGGIFCWAAITHRCRDALRLLNLACVISALAVSLPWYVLCAARNSDFFRIFIVDHNFKRYLTPEFQHVQPFWFFGPIILIAFTPWIFLLISGAIVGFVELTKRRMVSDSAVFFVTWAGFCLIFFSASRAKLPGYILPAIPAIGVLMALISTRARPTPKKAMAITLWVGAGCLLAAAGILATKGSRSPDLVSNDLGIFMLLGVIALTSGLLGWALIDDRRQSILMAVSALPIVVVILFSRPIFEGLNRRVFTAREVAGQILEQNLPLSKLFVAGGGTRGWRYSLNFYLHREITDWNKDPAKEAFLLSETKGCEALITSNGICTETTLPAKSDKWKLVHIIPLR